MRERHVGTLVVVANDGEGLHAVGIVSSLTKINGRGLRGFAAPEHERKPRALDERERGQQFVARHR